MPWALENVSGKDVFMDEIFYLANHKNCYKVKNNYTIQENIKFFILVLKNICMNRISHSIKLNVIDVVSLSIFLWGWGLFSFLFVVGGGRQHTYPPKKYLKINAIAS